jgi:thymidylate synthase
LTGLEVGQFSHTLVDAHIYTSKPDGSKGEYDHVPGLLQQIKREPRPLPKLTISPTIKSLEDIEALMDPSVSTETILSKFVLEGYEPHPAVSFKVAV